MRTNLPNGGINSPPRRRKARRLCTPLASNPGFAADYLPLVLTTQSASVEKIHSYEIALYDDYGVPDIMINGDGFRPAARLRAVGQHPWRDRRRVAGPNPRDRQRFGCRGPGSAG